MENDYCDECGGKPGGHKPHCSERFKTFQDQASEIQLKVGFRQTAEEYKHLGDWEAQIIGLPQARSYGRSVPEAVGKLLLSIGKDHGMKNGIEFVAASEMQNQQSFASVEPVGRKDRER